VAPSDNKKIGQLPQPMQQSPHKTLSLIIPVYNEADMVETFVESLDKHLQALPVSAEILFIDDGSTDGSWNILCALPEQFSKVTLIRFSRNFGKEAAILAGLERCTGDAAIVMDADLQHPPTLLRQMTEAWLSGDVDIVDGVKVYSSDPVGSPISSRLFNRAFEGLTGFNMSGASDYKLLSRRVIDHLASFGDYNLFFRGTTLWMGFEHRRLEFEVGQRPGGETKWGLMSRLGLAITAITSFTSAPLHLMTLVSLFSFAFAFLLGLQTLFMWVNGEAVEGFTTVIMLLLFFGSMITLGLWLSVPTCRRFTMKSVVGRDILSTW
jgi:polyisoprenyl-phosphate glycosyltransferase